MGSESIAHEAEGRMSCKLRGHEVKNRSMIYKLVEVNIQTMRSMINKLVGQKYRDKTTLACKMPFSRY